MTAGGASDTARAAQPRAIWRPGRHAPPAAGFTIAEILVATTIFAVAATALAATLASAQRARQSTAYWLSASQLAEEELERLRAGAPPVESSSLGRFERSSQVQAVSGYAGLLERLEVRVSWEDHGPKSFTLSALVQERR